MHFNTNERYNVALYGLLAALILAIFLIDLSVPLGTAVWVIYLVPTVLAYLAWQPRVPLVVAGVVSVLVATGFLMDRPGIDPEIAKVNRAMGAVTVWVLAATGYMFIRNKVAVRTEEWLQSAQVELAKQMVGELSLEALGKQIVSFLAEHLRARAAALFVNDRDVFVRMASYGVPSDAPVPSEIRAGDGLLGQAISDDRSFVLKDVPENYLYFGTALAKGKPASLVIAPTREDSNVNGVLEFGFAGAVPDHSEELLDRVAGPIGIALRSAQYRARLEELLEETRRQAEELRVHGEELTAANEELEEQSRALQDSQKRLEQQQAELEQSNAQLEEQTQLLEAQRDDLARTQGELQQQARELETASRYKSEFVANMSHELRTPLNALLIMARLLAENRSANLTSEQVRFAQTIESSGNDLLSLINDILDLSKIEAGKLDIEPQQVQIANLVDKLLKAFQPLGAQKKIVVRSEIAPGVPTALESDPQRLEQILRNFLSNAVKFTDDGEVVIEVRLEADDRIAFAVRDTGIGIAKTEQESIFEAFRQADGTINRKYGGTGLGLSISRELVDLLGGEIHVASTPGEGSTFTMVLPERFQGKAMSGGNPGRSARAARPSRDAKLTPAADLPTLKPLAGLEDDRGNLSAGSRIILVVEDDLAFARILLDLAHELGFQCVVASSADDGVIAARQYLPHAVILDIGLPDHSGLSVLDRLKRDVHTRHIPVHVVSVSDCTQTAMSYGAIGYMLKPVRREVLVSALERLENRMSQPLRRVLIVEDDPAQLHGLSKLLESKDVVTVGAATAAECLEKLRNETFDCMVLDLTLPDASGFDVLEQLNDSGEYAFPPVIVYTARELSGDEELRLRRYSKSIIIKGAKSPERLIDEVTLFLHQVVSELPEEQRKMLAVSLNRDALLEGRRILVVEDDIRNVFAITSIFEPHGATVQIARNGLEALQALRKVEQEQAPAIDLVLMDVMMPEMDGLTAVREIRSQERWKSLPIIMLTAKAMADDQEQCLASGANDYLAKPLEVEKLLSLARVWMPR